MVQIFYNRVKYKFIIQFIIIQPFCKYIVKKLILYLLDIDGMNYMFLVTIRYISNYFMVHM